MTTPVSVLLLEDSTLDARIMLKYIRSMGDWEVEHAASLGEAEDIIEEAGGQRFELALVDLTLPDAVGLEAVEYVRKLLPDAATVVCTAEDQLQVALDAMSRGATDYIVKGEMTPRAVKRTLSYALNAKRLLRQAEQAESNLRRVLAASNDAVVVVGRDRSLLFSNAAAKGLLSGLTTDDGRFALDLQAAEELETFIRRESDGKRIPVLLRTRGVAWARERAIVVVIQDLSQDREMELAWKQLEVARGEVPRRVTDDWHNVKNVVLTARDNLDLILGALGGGDVDIDELKRRVEAARSCVDVAADTAWTYMPQTGPARPQRIDLNALVRTCRTFLSTSIENHATLRLRLGTIDQVVGDPNRLRGVAHNLMQNALDAIVRAGGDREHQLTVETSMDKGCVVLSVVDTGSGIPAGTTLENLTVRESSRPKNDRSAGVGLRGTVDTVREHGGEIWFESIEGHGTTFFVRFQAATKPKITQGLRVLVLEDQENLADVYRQCMSAHYDFTIAPEGGEGLSKIKQDSEWHAILCDFNMPGMNGLDFYNALRRDYPDLVQRVAFATGDLDEEADASINETERPRLWKPFQPDDLFDMIERLSQG